MTAPGQPPPPGSYTVVPGAANHLSVMASYNEQSVKQAIGGGFIDKARLNKAQFKQDLQAQTQTQLDDVAQGQSTIGDTGWRAISPMPGWTGTVRLRRIGPVVEIAAQLTGSASTSPAVQVPTGFTPRAVGSWVGAGTSLHEITHSGDAFAPATAQDALRWHLTFTTSDAWPATAPGTPA